MTRSVIKLVTIIFVIMFLLTSCAGSERAFIHSNKVVDMTRGDIQSYKTQSAASPAVVTDYGFYADATPIDIASNPAWLNNKISFRAQNLPFSFVLKRILRDTDAIVGYQSGVRSDKQISMSYNGTIRGALDSLAIKTNYAYVVNNKQINWSNFLTKNFDISFMPGSSDYMVGQSQTGRTTTTMRGNVTTVVGEMNDEQYSSLKGTLSVWNDLKETLNNLKSKDGTVNVSESTTSVLVRDHPSNVNAIARYIQDLNKEMSRQVELKVKILEVDLDRSHQYGIDWNLVARALHTDITIGGSIFDSIQTRLGSRDFNPISIRIGEENDNVLINALSTMGKVSLVTEPSVITLNNQVAQIRITTDTSYLAQSETSIEDRTVTTSMTPGVVTSGFMLYILPKVKDNRIYLQVSSIVSKLSSLDTINNFGNINAKIDPHKIQGKDIITIQIPTLAEKRFNMRSLVNNRATLVLGGFKQVEDVAAETRAFDIPYSGGKGSSHHNVETIILITPTIIENNANDDFKA
jgi:type IVB pilus formation R64 PilN family outer membrane protein